MTDCCSCLSETAPDGSEAGADGNCLPAAPDEDEDPTGVSGERGTCVGAANSDPLWVEVNIDVTDAACASVCEDACAAAVDQGYALQP